MNTNKNICVLIINSNDITTVDSLRGQTFEDFECFLMNNSVEQINHYIENDQRFHITDKTDIEQILKQTNCKYVIITDSSNVFIPTALEYINRMIDLTDADIINFNVKPLNDTNIPKHQKPSFNYICSKKRILEHFADELSCFCIKKDILLDICDFSLNHFVVLGALKKAKDMTTTIQTYVLEKQTNDTDYKKIVNNFVMNEKDFSFNFWKNYFGYFIPIIVNYTIKNNDRDTFIYCCKNIPLKLIPLKYKFIFFIMRITNK